MKTDRKTKVLPCRECGETVKNVGSDAIAVTCFKCVSRIMLEVGSNDRSNTNEFNKQDSTE